MKKFTVVFLLLFSFCFCGAEELLKFGVISDIQTRDIPGGTNGVWKALDKAFLKMKEAQVDAVLIAGDIGPENHPAVYQRFRKRFDEIFGANPPAFLAVMGNHDTAKHVNGRLTGTKDPKLIAERRAVFCRNLKVEEVNFHKVIKGYDFIGLSMALSGNYCSKGDLAWLKKELDSAVKRDPAKPVFVMAHNHAKDTVLGSRLGDVNLTALLKNYPQVIYFSGHTHVPLEDERTIHQKDFTSVGTGTLLYTFLPSPSLPYTNGDRGAGKNMLIVSCTPDAVVLRRYQLRDDSEILDNGKPWQLPLPLEKKNFVYENARRITAAKPVAPEFPEGAKLSAEWKAHNAPFVLLAGPAAKHPKFVYAYHVLVSRQQGSGWEKEGDFICYSDFYAGLNFRSPRFSIRIPGQKKSRREQSVAIVPGSRYRFEVIPVESFGTAGKPICTELTIPGGKK